MRKEEYLMQNIKRKDEEICPNCCSTNIRIVLYGLRTGVNLRDKSKYHFAGCLVFDHNRICYDCDSFWRE